MFKNFKFHHLGIATFDIEKTKLFYKEMGFVVTPIVHDVIQDVKICFLKREFTPLIELVAPLSENSPVSKIINTSGVNPYHTCYEVEDIVNSISNLKSNGFLPLFKPVPAIAIESRLICFLFNKNFGLIELLQSK